MTKHPVLCPGCWWWAARHPRRFVECVRAGLTAREAVSYLTQVYKRVQRGAGIV